MEKWLIVILIVFCGISKLLAGFLAGIIGTKESLEDKGEIDSTEESSLKEAFNVAVILFLASELGDAAVLAIIGQRFA